MLFTEVILIAGYLANPKRRTAIEAEIREEGLLDYKIDYRSVTGAPLPTTNPPVHVIPVGGDKWGREMRVYFYSSDDASIPPKLASIMTSSNRPGYEQYNHRVNNNDLIDHLIKRGFLLGNSQNETRIKSKIPAANMAYFNNGYNLP